MRAQQKSKGLAAMNLDQMYAVCIYGMRMVCAFISLSFETMICGRDMFWALLQTDTLMYQCILLNAYQSYAIKCRLWHEFVLSYI